MKGPSPFSTDQYTPLLCLWGIKSLKHKGGFCIKIQTMVHKTFFFLSLSCFMLYTFSLALFFCLPFNFPLLEGEGMGLLNEAGQFDFNGSECLQEAHNQHYANFQSVFSLLLLGQQNMLLWLLICTDSLTDSHIMFKVDRCHRSARRALYIEINKRIDSHISCNAPLILTILMEEFNPLLFVSYFMHA